MATLTINTEIVGRRVYVLGNTYPIKSQLREAGCSWDGDRKQWWIGTSKREELEALLAGLNGQEAPREDLSTKSVYGKAEYNSRTYYVIAETQERLRLVTLDGAVDFWKPVGECRWTKRYQARTEGRGRYTREVYQTLGGIRRFIEQQRDPETAIGRCVECDSSGPVGRICKECHEGTYV